MPQSEPNQMMHHSTEMYNIPPSAHGSFIPVPPSNQPYSGNSTNAHSIKLFFRLSSILYFPYWFKYIRLIFELIVFSRLLSLRRINDARVTNDIPSTISSTSSPSSDAQSSSNNFYDFDSKCSRCCSITSNSSSAGNTLRSHLLSYLFWVKLWYYSWKIKASHHWCRYTMLLLH